MVQQPGGSYVLEVFHGFLAIGGEIRLLAILDEISLDKLAANTIKGSSAFVDAITMM